jgi:hypothetical protein
MGGSHATIDKTPVEAATISTAVFDSSVILVRPDNGSVFARVEMNKCLCNANSGPTVRHSCFYKFVLLLAAVYSNVASDTFRVISAAAWFINFSRVT